MASQETFYSDSSDLRDLTHPVAVLRSKTMPLTLRPPKEADLQALIDIIANPENTKNDLSVASLSSEERESVCRRWLALNDPLDYMNFIVINTEDDKESPVGIADLGWIGPANSGAGDGSGRAGAAGVMVNPDVRRKGFGTEALKIVTDYGLRKLGLVEVRVGTPSSNTAMRRLMEVRFQMEPEVEKKGDRFGNDLLWRINNKSWSPLLG